MKIHKKSTSSNILFLIIIPFVFIGCKKFVQIDGPKTSISSIDTYNKDATAISVLTGIYAKMSAAGMTSGEITSISFLAGLSSDELTLVNDDQMLTAYFTNSLTSESSAVGNYWYSSYPDIYVINEAIAGISNSTNLNPSVKKQLLGEAKFMRAFNLFYLVNLYGDVPLIISSDYKINAIMPRTQMSLVWEQIITDLKEAQNLLSLNYLDASLLASTEEKVRPTIWAATALLARAYLYTKDWKGAEEQASKLINNTSFSLVNLDDVFKKNSKEAIWQLQPVVAGVNSNEGRIFILDQSGPNSLHPVHLNADLVNSFDAGDQRKNEWINILNLNGTQYSYAYKYKVPYVGDPNTPVEEYSTVFRLGEQYLIRAESKIQQKRIAEGILDLNIIRDRATKKGTSLEEKLKPIATDLSFESALSAVERERRNELFTEWGHRWFDLKRTGRIDQIMTLETPKKVVGGIWHSYQQWMPIPLGEIRLNPNLVQTSGY